MNSSHTPSVASVPGNELSGTPTQSRAGAAVLGVVVVALGLIMIAGNAAPQAARSLRQAEEGAATKKHSAGANVETASNEADDSPAYRLFAAERRFREAMRATLRDRRVTASFKDVPLNEAVRSLCRQAGVENVQFDEINPREEGIDPTAPVTAELKDAPLGDALRSLLEPRGLDTRIHLESLVVLSRVTDCGREVPRTYDIRSLRPAFAREAERRGREGYPFGDDEALSNVGSAFGTEYLPDIAPLLWLIENETSGPWVNVDGTGGDLIPFGGLLSVRQTEVVHEQIGPILSWLEAFLDERLPSRMIALRLDEKGQSTMTAIWTALAKRIGPFDFDKTPLDEVLRRLGDMAGVTIVVDRASLNEEGVKPDAPVTFRSGPMMFDTVTRRVLEPFGLKLSIDDGALMVVTTVKAEEKLMTILHDIRDLPSADGSWRPLRDLLWARTSGPWMDVDGTGGSIDMPLSGLLVVRQTHEMHLEVAARLQELRLHHRSGNRVWQPPTATSQPALTTGFYPQADKVRAAQIAKVLVDAVAPESWTQRGGRGTIHQVDEVLIIRHTPAGHQRVKQFFWKLNFAVEHPQSPSNGNAPIGY